MITNSEWIIFDTNIWIFGLREEADRPACFQLLRHLPQLSVKLPRQILRELRANLTRDEMSDLFRLLNHYPERIEISWNKIELSLIRKYQSLGCKLGDATVAAHVEALGVKVLVSENRDFLTEIQGLPFQVLSAEKMLQTLIL